MLFLCLNLTKVLLATRSRFLLLDTKYIYVHHFLAAEDHRVNVVSSEFTYFYTDHEITAGA